jgi:tetratricopeptide (TPR) repeat protein
MAAGRSHLNRKAPLKVSVDIEREVAASLEAELMANPGYADLQNLSGLYHMDRGNLPAATRAFEAARKINPRYLAAGLNLGHMALLEGRVARAEQIFRAAALEHPESPMPYWGLAVVRTRKAEFEEAAAALETSMTKGEPRSYAQSFLAVVRFLAGDMGKAVGHLAAVREVSPRLAEIRGDEELFRGADLDASEMRRFTDQFPFNPERARVLAYKARIYAQNGLYDEASRMNRMAFLTDMKEDLFLLASGRMAALEGDEETALRLLREAVSISPKSVEALMALAFEEMANGDVDAAIQALETALAIRPGYADVHYNLGLLYAAQGRHAEAIARFRGSLEINPRYAVAQVNLAFTCFQIGDFAASVIEYQRALARGILSADIYTHLGAAEIRLGRWEDAIENLRKAVEMTPDAPLPHYYLGQAYHETGMRAKAREAWKRFLRSSEHSELADEVREALAREKDAA